MTRKIKRYAMKAVQVAKDHKAKIAAGLTFVGTQASALTVDTSSVESDVTTVAGDLLVVAAIIFGAFMLMKLLRS